MHFSKLPAFNYVKLSNNTFDIEQFMFLVFHYNEEKKKLWLWWWVGNLFYLFFVFRVPFLNESMSENDMHALSHIDLHPLTQWHLHECRVDIIYIFSLWFPSTNAFYLSKLIQSIIYPFFCIQPVSQLARSTKTNEMMKNMNRNWKKRKKMMKRKVLFDIKARASPQTKKNR